MIGKGGINAKDCHNRTPLHHAAAFQFPDLVKMLQKKGADPNAKTMYSKNHFRNYVNVTLSLKPH